MFTQKDQLKFEIISKLSAGLIDTKLASRALDVSWGTLQGRLVPELRLANITTKKQANRFLHETFIPNQYNKKFLVAPLTNETSYRPCFRKDLNEIFSEKEYRTIKSDQSFNYNSKRYLLDCYPGNLANKMVQIRTYQNREIRFFWADKELSVVEFDQIAA